MSNFCAAQVSPAEGMDETSWLDTDPQLRLRFTGHPNNVAEVGSLLLIICIAYSSETRAGSNAMLALDLHVKVLTAFGFGTILTHI